MFTYRRSLYGDIESADVLLAIAILIGLIVFIQVISFIYRKIKKSAPSTNPIPDLTPPDKNQSA